VMATTKRLPSALRRCPRINVAVAVFCIAIVGAVWTVTLQRVAFERQQAIADAIRNNDNLAMALEEHTVRTLKGIDQTLQLIKSEYGRRGPRLSLRSMMEDGEIDKDLFNNIGVVDEYGNLIVGLVEFKPTALADREYFRAHQAHDTNAPFIGKPLLGRVTGKWAFQISRRINKADDSFGGIIYASVDPAYFSSFYQQADLGELGLVTLVGLDGITRARQVGQKATFGEDMRGSTLFAEQAKRRVGSFVSKGRLEGVPRFYSFRTLTQYPLIVAVGTSQAAALAAAHSREREYFLGAGLASLFTAIFAFSVIAAMSRHRKAAAALLQHEARFRATFDQASVGIAHTAIDGTLLQLNRSLCDILGLQEHELVGRNWLEFVLAPDRTLSSDCWDRLLVEKSDSPYSPEIEQRLVHPDGTVIWVHVACALVRNVSGSADYFVSVIRDVTARKEVDERYHATFSLAAVGIAHAAPDGSFIEVNAQFAEILGYTPAELKNMSVRDIVEPDDLALADGDRIKLATDGSDSAVREFRFTRKDGSKGWAVRGLSLVRDPAGEVKYFIAAIQDITARKNAETALQESEERFRLITETIDEVFWIAGVKTDATFYISPGYERVWRRSRESLLANPRSFLDPVHPDDKARVLENLKSKEAGQPHDHEYRIFWPDGSIRWIWDRGFPIKDAEGTVSRYVGIAEDITERKRVEAALYDTQEQFHQLAEHIPEAFWITDIQRDQVVYVSPAYEQIFGQRYSSLEDAMGAWYQAIHPADRERTIAEYRNQRGGNIDHEYRIVRPDGVTRWLRSRGFPVLDAGGVPYRMAGTIEDVTERRDMRERLLHQAQYDSLTQLPNRALCYDRLKQAINQAQRRNCVVGCLFIDLDRFKTVNDTLGHAFGDELLKQAGERLAQSIRSGDTVARLGGDEFAVILCEIAQGAHAGAIAQKIIDVLSKPFQLDGHEVFISASIGVTIYPGDGADADTLIKNADVAMYHAKEHGRNNYQFYAATMNEQALENLLFENGLRRALERNEFLLHFQPKLDIAGGKITGCEALLRWQSSTNGLVPPNQFIPLLEESGMIVPVGEWVINAACAQIREWKEAGVAPVPIAVNLSSKQFQHQDICNIVDQAMLEHDVDARYLEFEITESAAMQNAEAAIITLQNLKALGVRISIDGFGTGYSSLSYLKRFPVDALKLDRSFVDGLPDDPNDAAVSQAVIAMAHSLGLTVIAEGVETQAQRTFLARHDCDELQGFYFARPLPAGDFTRLLQQGSHGASPEDSVSVASAVTA